jgi:beta-ribofuranosylaminobenzene 5'-phosphate synthase
LQIETSARLHLSLIDLNGSEGRIDGGIGITLNKPLLKIDCQEYEGNTKILFNNKEYPTHQMNEYTNKILNASKKMQEYLNINKGYIFNIKNYYQIHQGLGLGTQLSLSTGQLIARSNNVILDSKTLGTIVGRGGTSGIGVESFNSGGLIVDGGHKKESKKGFLPSSASNVAPPPVIARYDFPEDWKIILATPNIKPGASGSKEIDVFQTYSPVPLNEVERISHLILMKLIPSLLEHDIINFGDAINKIQGLGFKKVERKLQAPIISKTITALQENGATCAGMSSFGPTCFGITDTNSKNMKKELIDVMGEDSTVIITTGKNKGATIR